MTPDNQQKINELLTRSAKLIDEAITPMCEAACIATMARQFTYAANIIRKASVADNARAEACGGVIEVHSQQQTKGTK